MRTGKSLRKRIAMFLTAVAVILGAALFATGTPSAVEAASKAKQLKQIKTAADKIIKKQTKTKDSKKTKLKKLYQYVAKEGKKETFGYANDINFYLNKGWTKSGWERTYALAMLNKKNAKGSCYHYAAAFAFLAKRATGYTVRIGVGRVQSANNKNGSPHAWVEVKIGKTWYICDPNRGKYVAKKNLDYYLKKRTNKTIKKTYMNFKDVDYTTVKF